MVQEKMARPGKASGQLTGDAGSRRIVLTNGNLAVTDVPDNSAFARGARSQFIDRALPARGAAGQHAWLTPHLQRIRHSAYNAERGPVSVAALRLHAQY